MTKKNNNKAKGNKVRTYKAQPMTPKPVPPETTKIKIVEEGPEKNTGVYTVKFLVDLIQQVKEIKELLQKKG